MGFRPGPRTSTGPMSQYPAVRGLPENQQMYSQNSRRMRAALPPEGYEGTRSTLSPRETRGVQGGNWQPLPPPVNDRGCPVGWAGEGDNVSFRALLPGPGAFNAGVASTVIVSAPYEFEARYLILEAFINSPAAAGGPPALGLPVPAGSVYLQSARTANGPDALFSSNGAPGIDVSNYAPGAFVPRDCNFPSFYNQPGISLLFQNEADAGAAPEGVILVGTFWGVSAHAGAPNLG